MSCALLLVEDHELSRRALATVLRARGHAVHEAATGEGGMKLLSQQSFTVVIADLRLPGLVNGLDVLRQQNERSPGAKLLLLTAFGSDEVRRQTENIGAVYIEKPISLDEVLSIVGP